MLEDFLASHRDELLTRAQLRVADRKPLLPAGLESARGLPELLDQLRSALQCAAGARCIDQQDLERGGSIHGNALFQEGFSVSDVVRDYGDLGRVITGLALEKNAVISAAELQTLNLCLEGAVAGAVTEHARQSVRVLAQAGAEREGLLVHEMRNYLNTATLALSSMTRGLVAVGGRSGAILGRSLLGLETLIERSFTNVRMEAGLPARGPLLIRDVIEEVEAGAALSVAAGVLVLVMNAADGAALIQADRQMLGAAITNLVQNAFKFTRPGTKVVLRVSTTPTRVRVAVEDACGGLPRGMTDGLLQPFVQCGHDRSGLGLGLSICAKAMQTMGGQLRVVDVPGTGCVFTLELPRLALAPQGRGLPLPLMAAVVPRLAAS